MQSTMSTIRITRVCLSSHFLTHRVSLVYLHLITIKANQIAGKYTSPHGWYLIHGFLLESTWKSTSGWPKGCEQSHHSRRIPQAVQLFGCDWVKPESFGLKNPWKILGGKLYKPWKFNIVIYLYVYKYIYFYKQKINKHGCFNWMMYQIFTYRKWLLLHHFHPS